MTGGVVTEDRHVADIAAGGHALGDDRGPAHLAPLGESGEGGQVGCFKGGPTAERVHRLIGTSIGHTHDVVHPSSVPASGADSGLQVVADDSLVDRQGVEALGPIEKVGQPVRQLGADAGGCFEDCRDMAWSSVRGKAKNTRILTYTDEIPSELIIVRKNLDPELKKKLKKALLDANKAEGILMQISQGELTVSAILEADPQHLDAVAKIVEAVPMNGK